MPFEPKKTGATIFDAVSPFLIVIIFAIVFGGAYTYFIQPELQKYLPGGPLNYQTVKDVLTSRTQYRDNLNALFTFYKGTTANAQDPLAMVLPSDKDIPTLYALFEKIAKDVGVGLQVIDISQKDENAKNTDGKIKEVAISLRFVNVDYAALQRLLTALEGNIRLTTINDISFDPANSIANFSVTTYYFTGKLVSPTK